MHSQAGLNLAKLTSGAIVKITPDGRLNFTSSHPLQLFFQNSRFFLNNLPGFRLFYGRNAYPWQGWLRQNPRRCSTMASLVLSSSLSMALDCWQPTWQAQTSLR